MLTTAMLLDHPLETAAALAARGYHTPLEPLVEQIHTLRQYQVQWEQLRALQNRGQGTPETKAQLKDLKPKIDALEQTTQNQLLRLPNVAHATTPVGDGPQDNPVVRIRPAPEVPWPGVVHADWAEQLGLHPELAAKVTGARFHVFGPQAARCARKLMQYAMDFYAERGNYQEHWVPQIVHRDALQGTGQWPKFEEDLFKLQTEEPWYLIPTGEVPLTNLYAQTTVNEHATPTPIKLMTTTACFRQEAGAAGRDTRGLLRQHQFDKLELVQVCGPHQGALALEGMLQEVCALLDTLEVGYRVMELCTKDMGFAGHKAYDIEVWFAGAKQWREVATLTWCGDFQARRMKTRYVHADGTKTYAHTLNGTGLAVGRVMVALFEMYFDQEDETLKLPDTLKARLGV